MVSIAVIGPKNSGKTTIVEKIQQKRVYEKEEDPLRIYSFKQAGKLVTLLDLPGGDLAQQIQLASLADAVMLVLEVGFLSTEVGDLIISLNLLGKKGLVVISKSDLVTVDEKESFIKKIKAILSQTALKDWPILSVSSLADEGFIELVQELLKFEEEKKFEDFIFYVESAKEVKSGITEVYGYIKGGSIKEKETITVLPWGKEFLVQSIIKEGEQVSEANSGRVALVFKGLYPWDLRRGDLIVKDASKFNKSKEISAKVEKSQFFKDEISPEHPIKLILLSQLIEAEVKEANEFLKAESKLSFVFRHGDKGIGIYEDVKWKNSKVVGHLIFE